MRLSLNDLENKLSHMEKDITNRVLRFIRQIWRCGSVLPIFLFLVVSCERHDPNTLSEEEYARAVENLVSVATSVEPFFEESQSVDDMVARMEEIKSIEGVVDAYASETGFYVDIEGWGVIGYLFDEYNDTPVEYDPAVLEEIVSMVPVRSGDDAAPVTINGDYKACVMNAQHKERQWTRPIADAVIEMFEKCGIEADLYDEPTLDFFKTDIFKYNLVFLIGHGDYDAHSGSNVHWLQTRETFAIAVDETQENYLLDFWPHVPYPLEDEVRLCRSKKAETRDGKRGVVFTYYISENFIKKESSAQFPQDKKAVLYVINCFSLTGDPAMNLEEGTYHDQGRLINDNMAQTFFDKGAGLYIGYDEVSTELAQFGGMHFFARLLSGFSFDYALNDLPATDYAFQSCIDYNDDGSVDRRWSVARHALTNGFDMNAFVVSPAMEMEPQPGVESYQFSAIASYSPDVSLRFDDYWDSGTGFMPFSFVSDDRPQYGFSVGRWPVPILGIRYPATVKRNPDTHRVDYLVEIPRGLLDPNTEYHVWPYIANGNEYNYGNEIVFTTGEAGSSVPVPEAIDMGLSVKWASFNVGAGRPEEHGHYYAWGETSPDKVKYDWKSYQMSQGEYGDELTRYCNMAQYGFNGYTDTRTVLEPMDDAAHAKLGGKWRMPTKAEFEELLNPAKCTVRWEPQGGVAGLKVTSKSTGKQVFFPASGSKSGPAVDDSYIIDAGTLGRYWSSSLTTEGPYNAYYLLFDADGGHVYNYYRYYGYPVRAVLAE